MALKVQRRFSPWMALSLIAIAEILILSVWFSASVVSVPLQHLWHLNSIEVALLTASVQLGFVIGALISSITGAADRFNARWIFSLAAVGGALVNALFVVSNSWEMGALLRMLTGIAMVGVYPVAVKLVTEWSPARRGTAVGILVGALTLGSALPHLILFIGVSAPWQVVVFTSSGLALLGAGIIAFLLPDHPNEIRSMPPKMSLVSLRAVFANKAAMLADYGYFGHMWELYAMWTWYPAFVYASFVAHGNHRGVVASATMIGFLVIGVAGAIGSVAGGLLADRIGRTVITSAAMAISGLCALTIGLVYGGPPWVVITIGMIWGVSVIADSAQFSAAVTELSAPQYIGTALTLQTAVGFLITIVSINLIAVAKDVLGWHWAFTLLSVGPFLGVYAMLRLRARASSVAMANGRR
ncbi:MAG: MFS transporter [Ferrimicrobium sp.]